MAKETAIGKLWKIIFHKKTTLTKMNDMQDVQFRGQSEAKLEKAHAM